MSDSKPILRWLGSWSPLKSSSPTGSPTSASLESLHEALTEPITRPPKARLRIAPPYFDSLTRSTLPLSSLQQLPFTPSHSPPSTSSLDSLRSLSARSQKTLNSPRWWFQKDNLDPLLDDADKADTVTEEREHIRRKYRSTKNPVVFCHGLLGFDSVTIGPSIAPVQFSHWRGIKEVLEANGTEVLITRVPATSSPVDRAKVLEEKISAVYPGRSVHLIGHSMGGLDCRYLTTHLLNRKFNVLSVSTIATPHRGSSFANHFLETLGKDRLPSFLSLLDLLPNGGGDGKAFEFLTLESMAKFNLATPDVDGVKYFSWGAVYEPGYVDTWKWSHSVILEKEGPNDGLVSVHSAKWGRYVATLEDVNHLDLVGWINEVTYKLKEMLGREIKFRPATFYLSVVDLLSREVEGTSDTELTPILA